MFYVFDLDGTLINNSYAIASAYLAAGVTMPVAAFGHPVGGWCSSEQHARKQGAYPDALRLYARPGRAYPAWNSLPDDRKTVITGASRRSALDALAFLGVDKHFLWKHSAGIDEKAATIRNMRRQDICYVDMDREIAERVARLAGCNHVSAL